MKKINGPMSKLTKLYNISGFPSLVLVTKNTYELYRGDRTPESLQNFLN